MRRPEAGESAIVFTLFGAASMLTACLLAPPLPAAEAESDLWYVTRNIPGVVWGTRTATHATVTIRAPRTPRYAEGRICPGIPGHYPGIDYDAHWIMQPAPPSYPDDIWGGYDGIRPCQGGDPDDILKRNGRLAISVANGVQPGLYDAAVGYVLVRGQKTLTIDVTIIGAGDPLPSPPGPPPPPPGPPPPPPGPPQPPPGPPQPGPPPPPEPVAPTARISLDGAECENDIAWCVARAGVPVTLTDASAGDVASRAWETGDGRRSTARTFRHAWSEPGWFHVSLRVSGAGEESEAARLVLVRPAEPAGSCATGAEVICLRDERFKVEARWTDAEGRARPAGNAYAGTNDSGIFRFFDRENWEILVKVLDGCATNGHVWVFVASTTDLGYAIEVTDTADDAKWSSSNEAGSPAAASTDTQAFPNACAPPAN